MTWNGRYFSTIILSINPLVFKSFLGYKLLPLVLLSVFYSGLCFFIKNLFENIGKKNIHIFSLFTTIVYLNLVPSLSETIYWMSASVTYFLAWGLTFYLMAFLIKYYKTFNIKYAFFSFIFMFCIIGSNELSAFLVLIIIGLKLIFELYERKLNKVTIIFAVLCLFFVFVVLMAPGNAVRISNYSNRHNLAFSLLNSFINLARITALIIKSPPLIILLLLIILNSKIIAEALEIFKNLKSGYLVIFIISALLTAYFFYFVSSYSMGINPPLRVHAFIALFIIITLLIIIINVSYKYLPPSSSAEYQKKLNVLVTLIFFLFILSDFHKIPGENIYIKGNIALAAYDLTHNAPRYNAVMNERYKQIEKEKLTGNKNITVPALQNIPRSIFFVDIKADSSHWVNWGCALYFEINSIKTTE